MNPRYKIGILVLGAIVPIIVLIALFAFLASKKSSVAEEYEARVKVQKANRLADQQATGVKMQLSRYEEKKKHWDALLKTSDVGLVTGLLKRISTENGGGGKFRQKEFAYVDRPTGIGSASKQKSVTYNISMTGTYQALQASLLSLESQLPNLSLNNIDLKPQREGQLLEAEVSYSAWIN